MKTKLCSECENFKFVTRQNVCQKKHKPRFYLPPPYQYSDFWGYKRKCTDFEEKKPVIFFDI